MALQDTGGGLVRDHAPIEYRLAVASLAGADQPSVVSGALRQHVSDEQLLDDLVSALREQQVATEIFPVPEGSSYAAYQQDADILLVPRLEQATFQPGKTSGRAALSGLLWLTTWIGGLWVEDTTYDTRLVLRYNMIDPHSGLEILKDAEVSSEGTSLSFFDRNEAFGGQFFASLLVPPFMTIDDEAQTAVALLPRSAAHVAARIKEQLASALPRKQLDALAHIEIQSPTNGALTQRPVDLRCDIVARRAVIEAVVLLNGKLHRHLGAEELPSPEEQTRAGSFICPVRVDGIELEQDGKNVVRLLVNVAGQWASRSLAIYRGEKRGEPSPSASTLQ